MFLDFRHLYYAAWHSPQTTAAKFLTKVVTRWKAPRSADGLAVGSGSRQLAQVKLGLHVGVGVIDCGRQISALAPGGKHAQALGCLLAAMRLHGAVSP